MQTSEKIRKVTRRKNRGQVSPESRRGSCFQVFTFILILRDCFSCQKEKKKESLVLPSLSREIVEPFSFKDLFCRALIRCVKEKPFITLLFLPLG